MFISVFARRAILAGLVFTLHFSAVAQGNLTPVGAPAPGMKTLTQIEPRTPISSLPFTISSKGSYYLTTNLSTSVSNAIVITASGVTLDLGGFTISSTVADAANGGAAILILGTGSSGLSDITIFNGHIRGGVTNNGSGFFSGPGFGSGIFFIGYPTVNSLVSRVSVSGCQLYGIALDSNGSSLVESCVVRTIGGFGILATTIKNSSALDCGSLGIGGAQASDCQGECYGSGGEGVEATTAINCVGYDHNNGYGISAAVAINCYGSSPNGTGVFASTATGCYGSTTIGNAVSAVTANTCYGLCQTFGTGIDAQTANNCVGSSNGAGYGIHASAIAVGCSGYAATGTGVFAFIANVCHGTTTSGTTLSTSHNINSF